MGYHFKKFSQAYKTCWYGSPPSSLKEMSCDDFHLKTIINGNRFWCHCCGTDTGTSGGGGNRPLLFLLWLILGLLLFWHLMTFLIQSIKNLFLIFIFLFYAFVSFFDDSLHKNHSRCTNCYAVIPDIPRSQHLPWMNTFSGFQTQYANVIIINLKNLKN